MLSPRRPAGLAFSTEHLDRYRPYGKRAVAAVRDAGLVRFVTYAYVAQKMSFSGTRQIGT
jgi:hypothetical protein